MLEISDMSLFEVAEMFERYGGVLLAIDEIHKSMDFERQLKNIYDRLRLQVIFSGSSALKLEHAQADLSRRADILHVQGLSFREFLELKLDMTLPRYTLETILTDHSRLAAEWIGTFKPLEYFGEYLRMGYYPFYFDDPSRYRERLERTINVVIEVDLPSIFSMKYENTVKLKKLVKLLCLSDPYTVNIAKLSQKIGIHRDQLYRYIDYLTRGSILLSLRAKSRGDGLFVKPSKLYLHNPNLYHAYCIDAKKGTIRETFFLNMLTQTHAASHIKAGDVLIDDRYTFEIGGRGKGFDQIRDLPDSYVAADDLEIGVGHKIPLWLFGFLY